MSKKTKTISVLLSLCLIVSMLTSMVSAPAFSAPEPSAAFHDDLTPDYIAPDIIEKDELETADYVGRVTEDEKDLYTFIFKNGDGSNTMRVFSHPVKYIDDTGSIRDISLEITKNNDGSFSAADHMIKADFGASLTEKIAIEYNDVKVSMKAHPETWFYRKAVLSKDGRSITYTVDDKTSYVYSLTYLGIKENIVVSEYTGQTEYEFSLFTNGLHPVKIDDSVFLADSNGDIKATIGDVIIFTADEKNNSFGDLNIKTVVENLEYRFTIVLDADYLMDERTIYPITIDPTLEINHDTFGDEAIEDVTINSLSGSSPLSWSLFAGLRETYGISRILMRFPFLEIPVKFAPLILSAQVEIRDIMCQGDEDITIYCYSYSEDSPTWSETGTVNWNYVGNSYIGTYLDSRLVSYGEGNVSAQRYGFNITSLAKQWADGLKSPAKGIVFKAPYSFEEQTGDEINYWYKTFSSYNRTVYMPSLTIKYEKQAVFTIRNTANGSRYLTATGTYIDGATFSTTLDSLDGTQMWCIEYLTDCDAVNIVSMGQRYIGGEKPFVIYNSSSFTGLGPQDYSCAYKQYKPIMYLENYYFFKNNDNSNYISISDSYDVLTNSSTQGIKSRFFITKIATNTFNNFFTGGYNVGMYSGVAHVKIQLDSSISSHALYSSNDFSAALWWNGITDNVIIYGPNDTVPSGITPLIVTFATDAYIGFGTFGVTLPNGITYSYFSSLTPEERNSLIVSDWNSVTIYLNGIVGSNNPFNYYINASYRDDQINKVICHEMGHALKLAHPSEPNNGGARHTFSGNRGNYQDQESVYAIMNQGVIYYDDDFDWCELTAAKPQCHDIINLVSKWEYHIDCVH
ncbi:MAG: hypothetical protein K5647_05740 [Clostridiales bacterium]|nr:hypothetical protein [Clostridiales bacterium]